MAQVAIELASSVPEFTGEDADGIIYIRTLNDVTYMGRPAGLGNTGEGLVFKLDPDGQHANRTKVRFGMYSVNQVQILEGLQPGDRVILSDMTKYQNYERVRLQ